MARKVYKTTDKIKVVVDDLTVEISPLSFEVKSDIQASILSGGEMGVVNAAKMAIKHSVKTIDGLENPDGSKYELEFDGNCLADSCVDDILNIDEDDKLSLVCTSLLNGIPQKFVDPQTKKPIKGIHIERPEVSGKKR